MHCKKKGEKLVNFEEGDTKALAERYLDDASCDAGRWTLALERTFDLVAVGPSLESYAPHAAGGLTLSGDGSSLHIHASRLGHRAAGDAGDAAPGGKPPRTHRYAAPDADIGWGSDKGEY